MARNKGRDGNVCPFCSPCPSDIPADGRRIRRQTGSARTLVSESACSKADPARTARSCTPSRHRIFLAPHGSRSYHTTGNRQSARRGLSDSPRVRYSTSCDVRRIPIVGRSGGRPRSSARRGSTSHSAPFRRSPASADNRRPCGSFAFSAQRRHWPRTGLRGRSRWHIEPLSLASPVKVLLMSSKLGFD